MKSVKTIFKETKFPDVPPSIKGVDSKQTELAMKKAIEKLSENIMRDVSEKYWKAVAQHRMREIRKTIGKL